MRAQTAHRAVVWLAGAAIWASALAIAGPAFAYSLHDDHGNPCRKDGSACNVYCDNGELAGVMFWNGSVWTDGVRWDKDREREAKLICQAQGTACT